MLNKNPGYDICVCLCVGLNGVHVTVVIRELNYKKSQKTKKKKKTTTILL